MENWKSKKGSFLLELTALDQRSYLEYKNHHVHRQFKNEQIVKYKVACSKQPAPRIICPDFFPDFFFAQSQNLLSSVIKK